MNVNDTEIAWAILQKNGYTRTKDVDEVRCLGSSSVKQAWESFTPPPSPRFYLECRPTGWWDLCGMSCVR